MSSNFEVNSISSGERYALHTDMDGDSFRVWRYQDGDIYLKTFNATSGNATTVRIPVEGVDDLIAALEKLKKIPCRTCGGSGFRG